MSYRSINLAHRGLSGLVARQFRVGSERAVVASSVTSGNTAASSYSSLHSINNSNSNSDRRSYSSTAIAGKEYAPNPLDAFRDPVDRQTRMQETVGRQWSAKELRRKSYEDLHGLWYVLYKERNMLLTEQQLSRRRQLIFPQPERFKKVQKSMGAIRQVLGERKREAVSAHLARHAEKKLAKQMTDELESQDEFVEIEEGGSENNKN